MHESGVLLRIDAQHPEPDRIARAARVLLDGGLVAFPTETVYGLGANALDADAVRRIYVAKGRPAWNPVIAHVASIAAARDLVTSWPDTAERLAVAFWPGPLTLVLPKRDNIPDVATAGLSAVGVRVPNHPVALALLRATGFPIAAPSANRFTEISPTTAQHVMTSLGDRVDLILDGGVCDVGIESTVLDLSGDTPTMLRPGMISRAQLAALLGHPIRDHSATTVAAHGVTEAQRSPGAADRHYAPRAEVWLCDASDVSEVSEALVRRANAASPSRVTALLLGITLPAAGHQITVRMPLDADDYARHLYAALHDADDAGSSLIVIERPPDTDAWIGVRNRLERAAH